MLETYTDNKENLEKPVFNYPQTPLKNKLESNDLSELESKKIERAASLFRHSERTRETKPKITEETRKKSLERINIFRNQSANFNDFISLIEEANPDLDSETLLENFRSRDDLRTELGIIIQSEMDSLYELNVLPERLMANTEKNPRLDTMPKPNGLKSQEYSAQLALSMLDGTFDDNYHGDGPIEFNDSGKVINGQHRAGALMVLGELK